MVITISVFGESGASGIFQLAPPFSSVLPFLFPFLSFFAFDLHCFRGPRFLPSDCSAASDPHLPPRHEICPFGFEPRSISLSFVLDLLL